MASKWFIKLYTKDILSSYDYQKMTLEEKGLYTHLLILLGDAEEGEIFLDEELLARSAGCSVRKFRSVFEKISSKFQLREVDENSTKIFNSRMKTEVQTRQVKSQKLSQNGAKGGRPSVPKTKANALANEKQMVTYKEKEKDKEKKKEINKERKKEKTENSETELTLVAQEALPLEEQEHKYTVDECVLLWNKFAKEYGLSSVVLVSEDRRKKFEQRQKTFAEQTPSPYTQDFWEILFYTCIVDYQNGAYLGNNNWNESENYRGRRDKPYKIDFDRLIRDDKIIEKLIAPYYQDPHADYVNRVIQNE